MGAAQIDNHSQIDSHSQIDCHRMTQALRLARYGAGQTSPNPSVGCVITDSAGQVAGTGWTQKGGRPHAEIVALAQAGARAEGGTAYITLEPCAHYGQTAPCAQALVAAGVACVVYAVRDPDPRVAGAGAQMLTDAGVVVREGCGSAAAQRLNLGFFKRIGAGRCAVMLKIAVSANGFMRTPAHESAWITGELARSYGHLLRAQHDALITGRGTVWADNPSLDCRLPGMAEHTPLPVVMGGDGAIPPDSILATRAAVLHYAGQTPQAVLEDLAAHHQVNAALLECGPILARAFMQAGMVDAVALFRAPHNVQMQPHPDSRNDLDFIGWHEDDFICVETLTLGADCFSLWYKT